MVHGGARIAHEIRQRVDIARQADHEAFQIVTHAAHSYCTLTLSLHTGTASCERLAPVACAPSPAGDHYRIARKPADTAGFRFAPRHDCGFTTGVTTAGKADVAGGWGATGKTTSDVPGKTTCGVTTTCWTKGGKTNCGGTTTCWTKGGKTNCGGTTTCWTMGGKTNCGGTTTCWTMGGKTNCGGTTTC